MVATELETSLSASLNLQLLLKSRLTLFEQTKREQVGQGERSVPVKLTHECV